MKPAPGVAGLLALVVTLGACGGTSRVGPSATSTVTAQDTLQFTPNSLTVQAGSTVVWRNGGTIGHIVTFDSGPGFEQPLSAGATVSRTFPSAGTFAYHCAIHGPSMHGTIVVR